MAGQQPEFGRRRAPDPKPPATAAPAATRKRGHLAPVAMTLGALGVGALAYTALTPSGPSCAERRQADPAVNCARSSSFVFLHGGGASPPAAAPGPVAAGLRPPIPDIAPKPVAQPLAAAPKAAAPIAPAAARGGFGASGASFFGSGGA